MDLSVHTWHALGNSKSHKIRAEMGFYLFFNDLFFPLIVCIVSRNDRERSVFKCRERRADERENEP